MQRVVWLAAALSARLLSAQPEPVAMVTDLVGTCESSGEEPCVILGYLTLGMRVRLDDEATLSAVTFESSEGYRFVGPSEFVVREASFEIVSGDPPRVESQPLAKKTSLSPDTAGRYRQAALVVRGDSKNRLRLVSPKDTSVVETHPRLRWEPIDGNTRYRVTVANDVGRTLVDARIEGTEYRLEDDLPIERGAFYVWRIEATLENGETYSSSADFIVLSDDEREQVDSLRPKGSASFSERVIYARFLESMDLTELARNYWRRLSRERPESPFLRARSEH